MSDFVIFINTHWRDIHNEKFEIVIKLIDFLDNHPNQFIEACSSNTLSIDARKTILITYAKHKDEFSHILNGSIEAVNAALRKTCFLNTFGILSGSFLADVLNEKTNGKTVFQQLACLSINQLILLLGSLADDDLQRVFTNKNQLNYLLDQIYQLSSMDNINHQYQHEKLSIILDKMPWEIISSASRPVFEKLNNMAQINQLAQTDENEPDPDNVGYYAQLEEHIVIRPELTEYIENRADQFLDYLSEIDHLLEGLEDTKNIYDRSWVKRLVKSESLRPFKQETRDFSRFWETCISVAEERILNKTHTRSHVIEKSYARIFSRIYDFEENAVVPNASNDNSPSR